MAGVMVNQVPILLFDEPLANLDPAAGRDAIELIDKLQNQFCFITGSGHMDLSLSNAYVFFILAHLTEKRKRNFSFFGTKFPKIRTFPPLY